MVLTGSQYTCESVGADCGIGTRVSHPIIGWAKFDAMVEGARIATQQLWGR